MGNPSQTASYADMKNIAEIFAKADREITG